MSIFGAKQLKRAKRYLDPIALGLGIVIFTLSFILPLSPIMWAGISLCGVLGLFYLIAPILLYIHRRPKFDWMLINGHFLRKVCCLVLLTPFTIATALEGLNLVESPKELTYEPGLYKSGDKDLPQNIEDKQENPHILWSVYYTFIDPGNQHMTTTKKCTRMVGSDSHIRSIPAKRPARLVDSRLDRPSQREVAERRGEISQFFTQ